MNDIYFISVIEFTTNHAMLIRADLIFKIEADNEKNYTIIYYTNGDKDYVKDTISEIAKAFTEAD